MVDRLIGKLYLYLVFCWLFFVVNESTKFFFRCQLINETTKIRHIKSSMIFSKNHFLLHFYVTIFQKFHFLGKKKFNFLDIFFQLESLYSTIQSRNPMILRNLISMNARYSQNCAKKSFCRASHYLSIIETAALIV